MPTKSKSLYSVHPGIGMRANYGCSAGDRTLFGDIDRSQPVWRIFSHTDKSIALTQSAITVAWY